MKTKLSSTMSWVVALVVLLASFVRDEVSSFSPAVFNNKIQLQQPQLDQPKQQRRQPRQRSIRHTISTSVFNAFLRPPTIITTTTIGMVSSSTTPPIPSNTTATASASQSTLSSTNTHHKKIHNNNNKNNKAKYPILRGDEVDSRKIIHSGLGRRHLSALRISHILFLNEELAQFSLMDLRSAKISFEDLAKQISACEQTRDKGGSIGWMDVNEKKEKNNEAWASSRLDNNIYTENNDKVCEIVHEDDEFYYYPNEHLDLILPKDAREKVVHISTKPGDIFMVESARGYHLVQIVDVMANVRKMATVKTRKRNAEGEIIISNNQLRGGQIPSFNPISFNKLHDKEEGEGTGNVKRDLTYKLETMGCQMNMADSERIEGQLQSIGIRPIRVDENGNVEEGEKPPDVVVLNTCSIRDHAEQKVYSYIGPHAKRKREGDDVTIIIAGCVAQQEGEALLRRAPEVDLVMGPQYANRIGDLLEDVSYGNQVVATEATHIMEDSTKPRRQSTVAVWVNVIYGCNERCAFCIVPTTRGAEQSRPVESIVNEVQELVQQQGYKEITLLGQNIDAYGRDMIPKRKFSDLIRIVGNIDGLQRLRFVTSHPRYMSLGVVDAIAETQAACESFHIPFQSGSNEILAAMGRGHTREKYLHIIERIRSRIPDASITADAIVGFPGETEKQFQDTLSLMDEVVFDSVNTAAYSPRPNTPAAVMDNQIDDDVKQDRLQRINIVNLQHAAQRRSRMMDRVVEILVEERNVRKPTQVMGRTRHGYIVYCEGDIDKLRGQLVNVMIDTCETYYLAGKII